MLLRLQTACIVHSFCRRVDIPTFRWILCVLWAPAGILL